jgi:hypothetical protein
VGGEPVVVRHLDAPDPNAMTPEQRAQVHEVAEKVADLLGPLSRKDQNKVLARLAPRMGVSASQLAMLMAREARRVTG